MMRGMVADQPTGQPIIAMASPDPAGLADGALLRLLSWLSPAFPTGAFACSHGLEWAVACGAVTNEAALLDWLTDLLAQGSGRADAILLHLAHRACADPARLTELAELARALATTAERRTETESQGSAFCAALAAWGPELAAGLPSACAQPVAVGAATGRAGIAAHPACLAFLHGWSANLVSAGVRLIPLGQRAGLRVQAALEPLLAAIATDTAHCSQDDLAGNCFAAEIAAMHHETQHTRLFRT